MKKIWKKKILEIIPTVISVGISMACVLSIIISSGYSVLAADDFGHAYKIGFESNNLWEYILTSLNFSKEIYMTWQGTYFSMFIQALLSPVNNFGMPQLRIVMLSNSILFFSSLFFLIWTLFRNFNNKRDIKWVLFIYTCLVYMITAYDDYREIFFWFSGAASYTFPLSLLFFSLGGGVYYISKKESINI